MRKIGTVLAAVAVVVSACGGGGSRSESARKAACEAQLRPVLDELSKVAALLPTDGSSSPDIDGVRAPLLASLATAAKVDQNVVTKNKCAVAEPLIVVTKNVNATYVAARECSASNGGCGQAT